MSSQPVANDVNGGQSVGVNVLTFRIPGIRRPIDVAFPNGKLPVCARCKRLYKTRELCRVRDGHTAIPWNTTFLSISLDDSCLVRNNIGEYFLIDEEQMQCRFTARLLDEAPVPFQVSRIFKSDKESPICGDCKDKNYTKHHCREKQEHTQLPWVTVYLILSAVPDPNPPSREELGLSQAGARGAQDSYEGAEQNGDVVSSRKRKNPTNSTDTEEGNYTSEQSNKKSKQHSRKSSDDLEEKKDKDETSSHIEEYNDDLRQQIDQSRTFLLTINDSKSTLRWLRIDPCIPKSGYSSFKALLRNDSALANNTQSMLQRSNGHLYPFSNISHQQNHSPREGLPQSYLPNQNIDNQHYSNFMLTRENQSHLMNNTVKGSNPSSFVPNLPNYSQAFYNAHQNQISPGMPPLQSQYPNSFAQQHYAQDMLNNMRSTMDMTSLRTSANSQSMLGHEYSNLEQLNSRYLNEQNPHFSAILHNSNNGGTSTIGGSQISDSATQASSMTGEASLGARGNSDILPTINPDLLTNIYRPNNDSQRYGGPYHLPDQTAPNGLNDDVVRTGTTPQRPFDGKHQQK